MPRSVHAFSRSTIGTSLSSCVQKSDRQQAREAVAAYHEAELAELVAHVAEAIDRLRSGELKAFDVDEVLFQYSRAAKELWKFCNIGNVQVTAGQLHGAPPIDWWERGTPRHARRPVDGVPNSALE
jgi:hypothetical protein